jgi:phosphoesterase RecJ-like protein
VVVSPNEFLAWMPGSENVKIYEKTKKNCTKILEDAEIIFTLDFNALHWWNGTTIGDPKAPFIMIDHHQNQMIMLHSLILILLWFNLRNDLHFIFSSWKKRRYRQNYWNLYLHGILTDSGSFRFPKPLNNAQNYCWINRFRCRKYRDSNFIIWQ